MERSARWTRRSSTSRTPSATCTSARWRSSRGRRRPTTSSSPWSRASCRSSRATARRCASCPLDLGPAGVGRRPALQPRLPRPPHRAARARAARTQLRNLVGRVMAQQLDRHEAAVGDVDGRGPRGRPLGADLEGPPLHGRRRRRAPICSPWSSTPSREPARAVPRRVASRGPSRRLAQLVGEALVETRAQPVRETRAACDRRRARPRQDARSSSATSPQGLRSMRGVRAADTAVVAQRADRPAPPLGVGAHAGSPT